MPQKFRVNIAEFRRAKGWTQKQLGIRIHRERTTIADYESGRITPSAEVLYDLSVHLDVPVGALLEPLTEVPMHSCPATRGRPRTRKAAV